MPAPRPGSPPYIYLSPPHVGDAERELLMDAFDSNWVAPVGPHLDAFEQEVVQFLGGGHAVALSSGTAALHLSLLLLGVGSGDTVLVPSLTFAATANAVVYTGARPVFIDSSADTWTIDPELVAQELAESARKGRLPKVLITVDLYGQCADYGALERVCAQYGVAIVEDAAESLGSSYRGRPAGTLAPLGVLSFNGNKIITCGGGGMLLTSDQVHADRARHLATQAREPAPHYEHHRVGYNYRLSNLLAAVGRGQLRALPDRVAARRGNYAAYAAAFSGVDGIEPMQVAGYGVSNCWLTCLLVDPGVHGVGAEEIRLRLQSLGIEARPTWKPMHLQPVFADHRMRGGAVSEDVFARGLCLPSGSNLSTADRDRVVDAVLSTALVTSGPRR